MEHLDDCTSLIESNFEVKVHISLFYFYPFSQEPDSLFD